MLIALGFNEGHFRRGIKALLSQRRMSSTQDHKGMENQNYTLIQQVKSPDPDTRRHSIVALGKSRLSGARQEVIELLIASLEDEQLAVREAAERALISLKDRDVVEALIPCLSSSLTTTLNYAVEILSAIGDVAIDRIAQLLESKNHDIRKFGCDILGTLKDTESIYELIDLLNDPHVNVAIAAGEALGKIKHTEAVPYLIRALQHQDTWMRCIAAEALGKIGDSRAVDPFISMSPHEDPIVLYTVIKAMGNFHEKRVLPYILSILQTNPMFAPSAAQAIVHLAQHQGDSVYEDLRHAGIGEHFLRLLSSDNHDVLQSAIVLIGQFQLQQAVRPLGRLLEHNSEQIVNETIDALVRIGKAGLEEIHTVFEQNFSLLQPETLEQEGEKEPPPSAKIPIIRVLGQIGSPQSIGLLIRALDESVADEIRVEAVASLAKILSDIPDLEQHLKENDGLLEHALSTLIDGLSDSNPAFRICAAEALGDIGLPRAYPPLLELLHDPSLNISDTASWALTKIRGLGLEEKLGPVRRILETPDQHTLPDTVRASVLRTLYRMAGEAEADFLSTFLDDPSNAVKVAVLEAFQNFSPPLTGDIQLMEKIRTALHDDDFQIRITALHALRHWGTAELNRGKDAETVFMQIFDEMLALLEDPHPRVQYEACQQLPLLLPRLALDRQARHTVIEALLSLIRTEETLVQIAAVEALALLQNDIPETSKAIPLLQELFTQTHDRELQQSLQKTLAVL